MPAKITNLVRKVRSQGTIERYDQVIQDQIDAEIVERVSGPVTGSREFYISHTSQYCVNQQKPLSFVSFTMHPLVHTLEHLR